MRIVHLTTDVLAAGDGEMTPLDGLFRTQAGLRHEVGLIIPAYAALTAGRQASLVRVASGELILGQRRENVSVFRAKDWKGYSLHLVAVGGLFDRPGIYGDGDGEYADNAQRFAFFAKAALRFMDASGMRPDILHCHGWQTGLAPLYLDSCTEAPRTVFTIDDLSSQGLFPKEMIPELDLPWSGFNIEGYEYWGMISFLKAGVMFSDSVTTRSPSYCREVRTGFQGMGFEGILSARNGSFTGVLDGLDLGRWNPENDASLESRFSSRSLLGRAANKESLQKSLGLPQDADLPLFAMAGPLDQRHGIDLAAAVFEELALEAQVAAFGKADPVVRDELLRIAERRRGSFAVDFSREGGPSGRIYAGCDFLLAPSLYEPRSGGVMIAMRYGAVPVVRSTGALADCVADFDEAPGEGWGFAFEAYNPVSMFKACKRAIRVFRDRKAWPGLQRRAMSRVFSWESSAQSYNDVYARAASAPRIRTRT